MDWGHPDPERHGHYRHFGRDVEDVLRAELTDCHVVAVTATDAVTSTTELRRLARLKPDFRLCT